MKAYTWDQIGCEVQEWDIPAGLVAGFSDPRLLARLLDAYIGWVCDRDNPDSIRDAITKTENGITTYEGVYTDRRHWCGLYFGPTDGSRDQEARTACEQALAEFVQGQIDDGERDGDYSNT